MLKIRILPVAQLIPAPYNPRRMLKPSDPAWKKLARSLAEFGLVEPLVWNERTGHVVGGHARLAILKEQGVARVPVSVVKLSAEREKALNVILNNREAQGRFDPVRLTQLLSELEDLPELDLTGFDAADLRDLKLQPLPDVPEEEATDDVEIQLTVPRESYESVAPQLDVIVRQFDLECHVRGL